LVVIKRKKWNLFHQAKYSAQNPRFVLIIIGWGESGKIILQVSIAVFWVLSKIFSGKNGSDPYKKLARSPTYIIDMQLFTSCFVDFIRCLTIFYGGLNLPNSTNTALKQGHIEHFWDR